MARLTSVIEKKSKTYLPALHKVHETILFPLYWLSDPIFQAWFGFANLKLWKNRAEFGQRPNISWKNRAKNRTNRAKNRTNSGKKCRNSNFSDFSCFFLRFKSWIFIFFVNSDHAWILYLSPCHRIIFECEIIVWGWEPVRYTRLSAHRTPA